MLKNYLKITGYAAALLALAGVAVFLVFKIAGTDKSIEVPKIEGKSMTEAAEYLNKHQLLMNIQGEEYHDEVPEGRVIRQNIKPGERVKAGTYVEVVVSRGQEMYSLPSFEGQMLEDAKLTLINLGLTIKKVTSVHSDSMAKGMIIAQRPLAGNSAGNEINFLVSLGPYTRTYRCPSFVNMTIDDARALASDLGIELIEKESGSKVIFQKPEAGAVIRNGDSVEVRLGRGWGMWF
ncbi:MAG: PASTA domain-containing protein [Nitrospiraceae bacterium]|nr:MAG: PASTA domain-containing protein [Nitrospiraceae bacterium]